MKRFIVLLILFAAGCMTANEKTDCADKAITLHDTLKVAVHDTIRKVDTVRFTKTDTLRIHDTTKVAVHDTVRLLANVTDSSSLIGIWDGKDGSGGDVTIAFNSSILFPAEFSGNIGGAAVMGHIKTIDNGQAQVVHAGYKDATWILSLSKGSLTVQEIGTNMFGKSSATLRKR